MSILEYLENYPVIIEEINNNENNKNNLLNIPIYVINLDRDKFRRGYIKSVLKKFGFTYKLVIVKKVSSDIVKQNKRITPPVAGCCLSHLWCLKNAIEEKHNHFLILEDDIVFHKKFAELIRHVDYKRYDMIQLGCCDFQLRANLNGQLNKNKNNPLTIYNPSRNALGAYGNIYNIGFAKLLFKFKTTNFTEWDTRIDMFYNKYKIGICYPNLITTELSTTNLGHRFSLFDNSNRFIKNCHIDFKYEDYNFIWVIFLEFCFKRYMKNPEKLDDYAELVDQFGKEHTKYTNDIKRVLSNNQYNKADILEIMEFYRYDKIK